MKLSRIALATVLAASPFVVANAGVTVTPLLLGYTFQDSTHNNGTQNLNDSAQHLTTGPELQDDMAVGAALGAELTPWLGFEAEYLQVKGDVQGNGKGDGVQQGAQYKQRQINGNFYATSDLITKNYDSKIKPYVLLGGGYYKYDFDGVPRTSYQNREGGLVNVGTGIFWRLNDALSLRTEARATYNINADFWNYTALAGLNVVIGGHLKPAAPVVDVQPVPPAPAPAPAPVVQQPQPQPQELTEDLNMELRVFFDTNKSNIKPQYRPEIAKVADALNQYPNATARIDGHTDNTGPRKLNERLSLARANSVKAALVNQYNIDASRLTTQGFAWDQPIADNSTKEGRAMNRRVFATITGSRTVLAQPKAQ
ncbi:outer membrane protein Omp38 [Acinetobacter nectaris]|uniref:outer membrane protein Omp38 n=1 Tax=Acinetobacter nectaris TaxID=1219382 RepID=UPI001F1CECC9|nr:OmpA family protein [Acinetobacter nectaris]MCF8998825.1 OmpA family protein [Acinetobacter nectaris]MCF9027934.1 OmpA family protein [Acinetobacter nectaris]